MKTKLYEPLVLSTLLYSAELWPVSVTQMKKLEPAHHRWQRSILGSSWENKVTKWEKVREATALPNLEDIIRCRRLRWLGHLSRMKCHRIPRQLGTWWWFQEKAWTPTSKLKRSHLQGSQVDRDRMWRGTGGSGGQEKLVDSCYLMRRRRRMNQEPGITAFVDVLHALDVINKWALYRVHDSRRPLDRLWHCVTCDLDLWPNIHWWTSYRDGLSLCQVWRF